MHRPIKAGAVAGIIILTLGLVTMILAVLQYFRAISPLVSLVVGIFSAICSIMFYQAFVVIARKSNLKLLKAAAVLFVVIAVLTMLFSIAATIYFTSNPTSESLPAWYSALTSKGSGTSDLSSLSSFGLWFLVLGVIFLVFTGVITILFGVGLLKLEKKLPLAQSIGIIDIIAGSLTVTVILAFVGILLSTVSMIMKIILLFKASRLYEK